MVLKRIFLGPNIKHTLTPAAYFSELQTILFSLSRRLKWVLLSLVVRPSPFYHQTRQRLVDPRTKCSPFFGASRRKIRPKQKSIFWTCETCMSNSMVHDVQLKCRTGTTWSEKDPAQAKVNLYKIRSKQK